MNYLSFPFISFNKLAKNPIITPPDQAFGVKPKKGFKSNVKIIE